MWGAQGATPGIRLLIAKTSISNPCMRDERLPAVWHSYQHKHSQGCDHPTLGDPSLESPGSLYD